MSPSLGQQLRRARTKRGLSLQDIAHITRIPVNRLADLEDDNYNSHGGIIYAKNFLRTYANLLEVDASLILDRLQPPPISGRKDYGYLLNNYGTWNPDRSRVAANATKYGNGGSRSTLFSLFLITGFVALLLGCLWYANVMYRQTLASQPQETMPAVSIAAPITKDQASLEKATFSSDITVLPAIPVDEARQISWNSPTQSFQLPMNHVVTTGDPVSNNRRPVTPVKAIPVE